MADEIASLGDAAGFDLELDSNAFLVLHSWAAGAQLLDFVEKAKGHLAEKPMTVEELAKAGGMNEGPLAVMLRTCGILGYASFDPAQGTYSLVQGEELEELETHLVPGGASAAALRSIYAEAVPPFKVPSSPKTLHCLEVWRNIRPGWRNSKSKILRMLLDGVVVAPVLTSILYYAHWDDEGQIFDEDSPLRFLDFTSLTGDHRVAIESMINKLNTGTVIDGYLEISEENWETLQQAESFFLSLSYAPLMAKFEKLLMEDASWGFEDDDPEEGQGPVSKVLHKVGKGIVEKPLRNDLMRHINHVFGGDDFASQPKAIMDVGSADGALLAEIYDHIKKNLPRGENLEAHPLLMISCDNTEDKRMAAAVNLSSSEVPHITHKGDVGKPVETLALLKKNKKKKIEPNSILHVRAFQDHARTFTMPKEQYADDSRFALYAKEQMGDFVHLDKEGKPIKAVDIFASLVEHFQRWSGALQGSFGLCLMEEMMLDIGTSKRFINDSLAFSSSCCGSLSRQYMIAPGAFCLAAAMVGLFPTKYEEVQNYPEQGKYTLVINEHLVRKPYIIRFAELSDLPELVRLEVVGWAPNLRKTEEHLKRRLETSPTTCYVCEMDKRIIAVLYVQKIASLDDVDNEVFDRVSDAHNPAGRILQLLAIVADTTEEVKKLAIGNELRSFVLHMARMDPGVDFVCAVTRCAEFAGTAEDMQSYVDDHISGSIFDPIVGFHTGYGAEVVKIVKDYRPEDTDNRGIGVLIRYDVKDWKATEQDDTQFQQDKVPDEVATVAKGKVAAEATGPPLGLEIVSGIMKSIGYPVDEDTEHAGFFSFGMDSLDLVRIRNRMGGVLGFELSTTLLLDYPNAAALGDFLDRERGVGKYTGRYVKKSVWETMPEKDIMHILDKFCKFYSLPQYQTKLDEAKDKAGAYNQKMYAEFITAIRNEVEGPILVSNEVITETSTKSIVKVRQDFEDWLSKHGNDHPRIRMKHNDMLDLIKIRQ